MLALYIHFVKEILPFSRLKIKSLLKVSFNIYT